MQYLSLLSLLPQTDYCTFWSMMKQWVISYNIMSMGGGVCGGFMGYFPLGQYEPAPRLRRLLWREDRQAPLNGF